MLGVLGVAWLFSDAIIRHGRAGAVAAQHAEATAQIQAFPRDGDDSQVVAQPPSK